MDSGDELESTRIIAIIARIVGCTSKHPGLFPFLLSFFPISLSPGLVWCEIRFSLFCVFDMLGLDEIFIEFFNNIIFYPSGKMAGARPGVAVLVVVLSIIIAAVLVDTSIVKISVFTGGLVAYTSNIVIFTFIVAIYAISQFIILRFTALRGKKQPKQRHLTLIYKLVSISQYVVLALLIVIILQMTLTLSYSVTIFKIIIWTNYAISIALLGLLAEKFFSWFRSKRDFVIIAYAIAMMTLSLNFVITIFYVTNELARLGDTEYIQPLRSLVSTLTPTNMPLNYAFFITSLLSFILTWFASVLLLRHYPKKKGRIRFWIIVCIPLVYFLSQFQVVLLNIFTPLRLADPISFSIIYTLVFTAVKPVGGILFGVAFWSVTKNIDYAVVKDYMIIAAFGLVLLFTSNQPTGLALVAFPPFGLPTISFLGLASYLIYVGIFSSAISVANDVELRKTIRKSVEQQSELLDNIGTAEMESRLQNRVLSLTRDKPNEMTEETGIESSFHDEEELRNYIQTVIEEVKMKKEKT